MHLAHLCILSILLSLFSHVELSASSYKRLSEIEIIGNKRTKASLIERELTHQIGDLIDIENLDSLGRANENLLQNTSLFNQVEVRYEEKEREVMMFISVTERWYFFPSPVFSLIDRNINEWWITHGRDLSRTKYGIDLRHFNLSGRNDQIDLYFQLGWTRRIGFRYKIPYLGEEQIYGLELKGIYSTQRAFNTGAENNRQVFYEHPDILLKKWEARIQATKRRNYKNGQSLELGFESLNMADTIGIIAPDLFLDGRSGQKHFSVTYRFTRDTRDRSAYPLEGTYIEFLASKVGLGIFEEVNYAYTTFNWAQFNKHSDRLYSIVNARAKTSFPSIQPYHNQEGLGYGSSVIRGYELYVQDGQHFILLRTAGKYRLWDVDFKLPFDKLYQFNAIPISFYPKVFLEAGYVIDQYYADQNPQNNTWQGSIGAGIDVVSFYDFSVGFEASRNRVKENNFFINVGFSY